MIFAIFFNLRFGIKMLFGMKCVNFKWNDKFDFCGFLMSAIVFL